ncbi:tRNA (N(6)-L-threonylcarbamoyladenosine(37)-C(2))-methylthiotransferase [Methanothermococcus okinawensis]|uniref:tRNA-t(6)A37 methylthiotransferase n=1 Tax=Methanothermococcus okinawensis (strain DSM 14208 / JCM 11175 / IH1) TaxID=647113 RepID=F8AMD3_METOI|nr:tRNA (N(6)-L-threonylcarbamoyladenosine(37)-C(2))-methylthiotransferase [Methanothermococcus okinawensis]AEH06825.1 MiaB-like tRNA modifying enzyme [Methanothermococcus okinawensis IH1]
MKKIYIEGYGCTLNAADTIIIKNSIVTFKDFQIVQNPEDADVVIINTCAVRLETEHKMISRIKHFKSLNKKVVVAGCMPKALREKVEDIGDVLIMPKEAHLSGKIVHDYTTYNHCNIGGNNNSNVDIDDKLKYLTPTNPENSLIMPLPISEGCIGKCTYCIVKVARGRLISYNRNLLIKKAEEFINKGVKHILITSQDTACYGFDKNDTLPNLINDIASIDGEFDMRIGMMHAKNVTQIMDELIASYQNDKVSKFLHLPIQSGDDKVLKDMKRGYTVDEFIDIVNEFKRKVKDLNFNTDVIVGFPTEKEENFENTLEVLKKLNPDYIHGAKYTQRRHTEAAKLKQVDTKVRKKRSEILDKLRRELSYKNNKNYIGKTLKVLITENNKGIAHNCKVVKFNSDKNIKIGEFRKIKITDAKTFGLFGEILD